ncbi:exodeoxyribonuclease VII large subunit [candidate division KSB1 bacterium]|nr:exodeoxyribonuclease VII large subunit [candidate division KSB1 bacterium]
MTQLSFEDFLVEDKYLTVTDLTKEIRYLLESTFREIWVEGEISNFNHHSSGHMYFSLKDENAQISCAMWRRRNHELFFTPGDGMKVVLNARVTVYEKRGNYQLDVLQIKPAGLGELQLAFEQLKGHLRDEGLFSEEYKKPIPLYPEKVGIVTSPTGAAIKDLVAVLRRRFPGIKIILNPVRVQGEGAAAEIVRAIDELNEYGQVDVLIVGRGGGSLEDLWAFNEESVARAVFRSQIPVVSAVGHEVDFSICDFVADLRAPTPSAAAELVVQNKDGITARLNQMLEFMSGSILDRIKYQREKVKNMKNSYAFRQPQDLVIQYHQRLDEINRSLRKSMNHKVDLSKELLKGLSKRLGLLEHNNVLKRGYSLTFRRSDGKLISKADELVKKDEIEVNFYQGKVFGTVNEVVG